MWHECGVVAHWSLSADPHVWSTFHLWFLTQFLDYFLLGRKISWPRNVSSWWHFNAPSAVNISPPDKLSEVLREITWQSLSGWCNTYGPISISRTACRSYHNALSHAIMLIGEVCNRSFSSNKPSQHEEVCRILTQNVVEQNWSLTRRPECSIYVKW